MSKKYKVGDKSKGACSKCKELVDTTLVIKDYLLVESNINVPDLLQGVCDECGTTVSIPHQSMPQIKKALNE